MTRQAIPLRTILEKHKKLTASDLQTFRENTAGVAQMSGKSDYFVFRMEVELIDAIRSLDEASANLIEKTNSLTTRILVLTYAVVALTVIQILLTVLTLFGRR